MSAEIPFWYVGDLDPSIQLYAKINGAARDLTGKSCRVRMRAIGSSTTKVAAAVSNTPDSTGLLRYDWSGTDTDTAGLYLFWGETQNGSKWQAIAEQLIEIRAHGQGATSLCELADVRLQMETEPGDDDLDAEIIRLIPIASAVIADKAGRQLFPEIAATHDVQWTDTLEVELETLDLRSITSIVVEPGTPDQYTLVAPTASLLGDYRLGPLDRYGVAGKIILSRSIPTPTAWSSFGYATLRVTGDWGMAAVPELAKQACVEAVRSWLRRDTSSYSDIVDSPRSDKRQAEATRSLPQASWDLLANLRRPSL